ncbi:MAG: hypothetical protein ACOC1K_00365 [Nanoarchaeota archaeon]
MIIEIEKNQKVYTNLRYALEELPKERNYAVLCKGGCGFVAFIFEVKSDTLQRKYVYISNNSNDIEIDYHDSLINDYYFDDITFEIVKRDDIKLMFERGK